MKTLQQILTEYGFGEPNDLSGQLIKEITGAALAELVVETREDYRNNNSENHAGDCNCVPCITSDGWNSCIDAFDEKKKELIG